MKKINWRVILIIVILILFESICYLIAKLTPFPLVTLTSFIDAKLPLIPWFVFFYVGWYLMLFVVPYVIFEKDKMIFYKYISLFIGSVIFSSLIFFFIPTVIVRGDFSVNNISTFLLKIVYLIDTPGLNCFPSMHCAVCFIFIYCIVLMKKCQLPLRILIILLSMLVILSTLFVKQHVIWDILGAFVLVGMVIVINKVFKIDIKISKLLQHWL